MFDKMAIALLIFACGTAHAATNARPYSHKELFGGPALQIYTGRGLSEIAFPLGGIGTGTVSLGGRGDLKDWEIFNRPGKGKDLPFTFFAIWAKAEGEESVARILERELFPPYRGGHGTPQKQLTGVSRLREAHFRGAYPTAVVNFRDNSLPVRVNLRAWNPFIPLNVPDSSIPVAILEWTVRNPSTKPVDVSVAATISNPIGTDGRDFGGILGKNLNEYVEEKKFRGLRFSSKKVKPEDIRYGTMALVTTWEDLDVQTHWYRGGWWDNAHRFWDDFSDDGRVKPVTDAQPSPDRRSDIGDVVLHATIAPKKSVTFPFFITWHFPKRDNYWNSERQVRGKVMENYVSKQFKDALDVASYTIRNLERLDKQTRLWQRAFFKSSLPGHVLDAVSSQASIIRTNTCMMLADGSFFAFEGCNDDSGSCPMNCTHVWDYAQSVAHLFPSLERSARETDFNNNTRPDGSMAFRTLIPLGDYLWGFKPAADGQMGCVVRAYREWKFSGDTEWLRSIWPNVKRALEYAWTKENGWDPNKDGVMEGEQHNTYDIEFYGPNTMMGSLYLAALRAGEEMARALGEDEKAEEYHAIYESGRKRMDKELWNGEWYIHKVEVMPGITVPEHLKSPEPVTCDGKQPPGGNAPALGPTIRRIAGEIPTPGHNQKALVKALEEKSEGGPLTLGLLNLYSGGALKKGTRALGITPRKSDLVPKYQYGVGCISDQLLGQWAAHVVGLGHLFDPEHTKKAVHSIFVHNWRRPIGRHDNVQRVYALNDEAGLLLCSWPKGNRPALPFVYSDEVWTGIEYQVAGHLIYEGWLEEGLSIVKGVRDRYDGFHRNPWNEVECGHHYARAMASWSVLLALSGCEYDGVKKHLGFAPRITPGNFRSFFSTGSAWGTFSQRKIGRKHLAKIEVLYGELTLKTLSLALDGAPPRRITVKLNGKPLDPTASTVDDKLVLSFPSTVQINADTTLEVTF